MWLAKIIYNKTRLQLTAYWYLDTVGLRRYNNVSISATELD